MNYSEAMEIRLRAAQRQPVDPEKLEAAKQVVMRHRKQHVASLDLSEVGSIDEDGKISMLWVNTFLTSLHPTLCDRKCAHLGICQSYIPCKNEYPD